MITQQTLIPIYQPTKSVVAYYVLEEDQVVLSVYRGLEQDQVKIPMNKMFQVQRRINKAIEKYWRRKINKL